MMLFSNSFDKFIKLEKSTPELCIRYMNDYILLTYSNIFSDSFDEELAKEMRGTIYSSDKLTVLRRPLHKFFNAGEKVSIEELDEIGISEVYNKLDGSMVAPFISKGELIYGTKNIDTDYVDHLKETLPDKYHKFSEYCINTLDSTPIFEYNDKSIPKSQIVVDYDVGFMKLLAIRGLTTGSYLSEVSLVILCTRFDIPYEHSLPVEGSVSSIIESLEHEEGIEGYVLRMNDDTWVKVKCPWYIDRHSVLSRLQHRHMYAQMVCGTSEVSYDDISYMLSDHHKKLYLQVENDIKYMVSEYESLCNPVLEEYSTAEQLFKGYQHTSILETNIAHICGRVLNGMDLNESIMKVICKESLKMGTYDRLMELFSIE